MRMRQHDFGSLEFDVVSSNNNENENNKSSVKRQIHQLLSPVRSATVMEQFQRRDVFTATRVEKNDDEKTKTMKTK